MFLSYSESELVLFPHKKYIAYTEKSSVFERKLLISNSSAQASILQTVHALLPNPVEAKEQFYFAHPKHS